MREAGLLILIVIVILLSRVFRIPCSVTGSARGNDTSGNPVLTPQLKLGDSRHYPEPSLGPKSGSWIGRKEPKPRMNADEHG